jgi:intraflagellar transport protein 88
MYSSWFNLATAYEVNDMPDDAIKTYTHLATQRGNPFGGRLRINMGNVYYRKMEYPSAIRMYKMALDQMQKDEKLTVHRIRRNIGNAYFRMGKIRDAVKNFEEAMETVHDYQTGFNLIVCHLALGDMDKAKNHFTTIVSIPADEDGSASKDEILIDGLKVLHGENKDELATSSRQSKHFLQTAARLIAPMLDGNDWAAGYDWVCSILSDHHEELFIQLKLEQATQRLHHKDFDVAIKALKTLQKKDKEVNTGSATNLSFISFLEGNIERSSEYADVALASDRYSVNALVNKANSLFVNGDFTTAKDLYLEAIGIQADCSQAIYNLGLVNAQLGLAEEAIQAFKKVHGIIPNDPQVLFQIADIYELQGRSQDAMKWFNVLAARVQSDPAILARLGRLYANAKDDSQGLHYQLESFRHYPTDLDVISWIGTWFVQQEMYER